MADDDSDKRAGKRDVRARAMQFIVLFGVVSAFGDITYEGARSVYGTYLGYLGASAVVVGLVTGFGEFLGYLLRLVSGYFIDRTRQYWLVTILGYAMLVAVPLLAVAGRWQTAAIFIVLERVGKAIRSPGKDTMLSHATKQLGTGFGFGIHEAMDQIGAIIGPLVFTAALASHGGYRRGFALMWIPALLAVVAVLVARIRVPRPELLEENAGDAGVHEGTKVDRASRPLPKSFWLYTVFTGISVLGFANFPIISYHFNARHIIAESQIPTLYALAMAVDAVVALIIGRLYDRKGIISLMTIPALTLVMTLLAFTGSSVLAICSTVLWGAVMGIHETIMRAAIADITTTNNRGKAYGIFNTVYGVAMLVSGVVMGFLYEYSIVSIIVYVVVLEILASVAFLALKREVTKRGEWGDTK